MPEENEVTETEETTDETVDETGGDSDGDSSEESTEEVDDRDDQIASLTSQLAVLETAHASDIANLTAAKDAVIAELRGELSRALRTLPNDNVGSGDSDDYTEETVPTFDDLVAKATGEKVE